MRKLLFFLFFVFTCQLIFPQSFHPSRYNFWELASQEIGYHTKSTSAIIDLNNNGFPDIVKISADGNGLKVVFNQGEFS